MSSSTWNGVQVRQLGVGRGGDLHVVDPDLCRGRRSSRTGAPPGGARGDADVGPASPASRSVPAQREAPADVRPPGSARPTSSRKKNGRRPRRSPAGPGPGESESSSAPRPSTGSARPVSTRRPTAQLDRRRRNGGRGRPVGVVVHDPEGRRRVAQLEVAVDDQVRRLGRRRRGPGRRSGRPCRACRPRQARTLMKGEPLTPPAGRADDFVWPRREVGQEPIKIEPPLAAAVPDALRPVMARATPPGTRKLQHAKPRMPMDSGRAQVAAPR